MADLQASSLHLVPCAIDDYFDIESEQGLYNLVQGILELKRMGDQDHDRAATFWMMTFNDQKPAEDRRVAMLTPSVEIPQQEGNRSNGASNSSTKPTVLRPDMAIGRLPTPKQRSEMPKSSRDIMFPKGHPPEMALEITSCDPKKDLETKPDLYRRAGVKRLHTLHRDKRGNGRNAFHRFQTLENGRYATETNPISNEPINDSDSCNLTSQQLMNPPSPDSRVRQNKAKQHFNTLNMQTKVKDAEKRAGKEKNRADKEKDRADAAENEAKAAKKSLRELQEQLKAHTVRTSNSSGICKRSTSSASSVISSPSTLPRSATGSPSRQRRKVSSGSASRSQKK